MHETNKIWTRAINPSIDCHQLSYTEATEKWKGFINSSTLPLYMSLEDGSFTSFVFSKLMTFWFTANATVFCVPEKFLPSPVRPDSVPPLLLNSLPVSACCQTLPLAGFSPSSACPASLFLLRVHSSLRESPAFPFFPVLSDLENSS